MASNSSKTLPNGFLKEKTSSQKISFVPEKEISRPHSAGRSSVTRMNQAILATSVKENPRPISADHPSISRTSTASPRKQNSRSSSVGRASVAFTDSSSLHQARKHAAVSAVRWSTSSLPRGRFADLQSNLLPRVSSSRETRPAGSNALDGGSTRKGKLGKKSNSGDEKSLNMFAEILDDCHFNGLGTKSVRNVYKIVDAKSKKAGCKSPNSETYLSGYQNTHPKNVSAPKHKTDNRMGVNGVRVSENQIKESGHENGTTGSDREEVDGTPSCLTIEVKPCDNSKEMGTVHFVSKSTSKEEGGLFVDNTANPMVKDCLNLQSDVNGDASSKLCHAKADSGITFLLNEHHREESTQSGLESVSDEGNIGMKTKNNCHSNKYQSKLHEKLAFLEDKVQKIALEIKQTKEMLNKNKLGESKLVLSGIHRKIHGVEKDAHGLKDGVKSESSSSYAVKVSMIGGQIEDAALESNEKLEEFDICENNPPLMECMGSEEPSIEQLHLIGRKISTGGWFVSNGEAVLLAHDDNSCSYYDIANNEVKSEYKPLAGLSSSLWGDCWLIRAPGADGCSGKYVVAASAGKASEFGFCSWDFYTKDVKAFGAPTKKNDSFAGLSSRIVLAPSARSSLQRSSLLENRSCWYRPCGSLLISVSGRRKVVEAYDIRDGDVVMTWEVRSPVIEMEYSSPLQWRSRGKVVIAEREGVMLWDVNSLNPRPVLSVSCMGKKVYSLHVNNTDAEFSAGVRQRASSTEVDGNDGVFCNQDGVNVLDFRIPSGIGLKISRHGANALSIFSIKDSVFIGSTEGRSPIRSGPRSQVEHFCMRKGKLVTAYVLPEFSTRCHRSSITQVWGNSNLAMGICGMGMFVFDVFKEEGLSSSSFLKGSSNQVKEAIGPNDLYQPTFDYVESRVLIISRDRPAFWRYFS